MKTLIDADGTVQFGHFDDPVGRVNYRDYHLRSPFRDNLPMQDIEKRFVHFHFLGFASQQFISGCSLSLANQETTVFFYLFDRSTGDMVKRGRRIGPDDTADVSLNPDDGTTHISAKGMDLRLTFNGKTRMKEIEVSLDKEKVLNLSFIDSNPGFETLRQTTPTGPNGWTYCQKVAGLQAKGELIHNGQTFDLSEIGAYAHHDFTAGFLRQDTFWNWACITGTDETGNAVGLNLSHGVNETGFSENALWINGKREPTGLIMFEYDLDDLGKPWRITSESGRLDLTFYSEGRYAAQNKGGSTPFDFNQLFGQFEGTILSQSGERIRIKKTPGFCERQYAIWWD